MHDLSPREQAEIASIVSSHEKECRRKLATNKNKTFAIQLIRSLHEKIDALAFHVKRKPTVHFDCKAGCSHCCTLRIEAVAPEIFLLARHLKSQPTEALSALIEKLKGHSESARNVRMEEFFLPCPLLVDDKCSVYDLRPTMCRKYLSMDVEECKKPSGSVPEDGEMVMKASATIYGFLGAYEHAKFSRESHELGQALLIALTDSSAEDRWFRGEVVFPSIPERSAYEP